MPNKKEIEHDGIYFLPGSEKSELIISYFSFRDAELSAAKPVDNTDNGNMYHVAFFKSDANGEPCFDDSFEAIFTDASTYVNNLAGANLYGCMVKKTEKSSEWFDDYLKRTLGHITMRRMIGCLNSILETK